MTQPISPNATTSVIDDYQPPAVQAVLTATALAREIQYAGDGSVEDFCTEACPAG